MKLNNKGEFMKKLMLIVCVLTLVACGKKNETNPTVVACPNYDTQSYCCVNYGNDYCGYVISRNGDYIQLQANGYTTTFNRNFVHCY